ncbi:MAG TPA: hypothetical protein PLZ36_08170 [Armatimonadota bacterium]|nr:hypothetical protein [Armatimonadota bacterium]
MSSFDPKTFWETRRAARYTAEGVCYLGLGTAYNGWMYRVRRRLILPLLRRLLAGVDAPAAPSSSPTISRTGRTFAGYRRFAARRQSDPPASSGAALSAAPELMVQ